MRAPAHETDAYTQHPDEEPDEELDVQWEEVLESKDAAGSEPEWKGRGQSEKASQKR